MPEYTLEIAGTEYPHVDLRYVRDYKFYGKLIEATIPEWVAAIAGDDAILIKRDGATVTSGKVKKITPFEGVGKGMGMVVAGYTKEQRHATLLANARTYNADPEAIIIDDIGSSDLTDGTTNSYGANIVVEFGSSDEAKFSRKMVYEEVAFITGWELYANPTGALDFKSQCGVDRSGEGEGSVAFKHGELLQKWFKPHMLNHLVKKTKVIVLGACEAEFEYYGIAGAGTDVYTIERKNLIDDNTCSLAAAAVYADMQNTLKVGVMDVIDTYSGAAYDVYDTIHVVDSRFGLDENVRIFRIERHIDKDGEHTRIFYTNITKLTCNGPFLIQLAKGELAAGQRVLRDFARVRQSGSYLGAGATFPTTRLVTGDTFQLTADIPSTHLAWFYHYEDVTPSWIRQPAQFRRATNPTYGQLTGDLNENTTDGMTYQWTGSAWLRITNKHTEGTTLPSSGMINGDTYYHTTQKLKYTYDGSSWTAPVTRSHDGLTDVGGSDHHSVFTSSQHTSVEHLASMLNQALQPYNSNIKFERKSGQEDDGITYTAGEIKFQDGTTRTITPAGELLGLSIGDNYIYFKTDSTSLFQTTSHGDAISSGRGLLAIIIVVADDDPDQPCAIQPFYAKGLNLTVDTLSVTLLSALSSYLGNVEIADGFILLGDTGIIVDEGDVIIDAGGIKVYGPDTLRIYDVNEVLRGSIFGVTTGCLSIYTPGWLLINTSVDGVKFNAGPIFPGADMNQSLGKAGASPSRWKYYVPRTTLAQRPAPSIDTLGLLWSTRETGNNKTKTWQCVQNDEATPAYEWIQTGIST